MQNIPKTSVLIKSQLPEFIRDNPDYSNFVAFLNAYYEWLETPDAANSINTSASSTGQGITYGSKNLLNFADIDSTIDGFMQYYVNDFLPYFPEEALISKDKAIKVARQLYQSKGTPASYQFLFKILFQSEFDFYNTKDTILRASAGTWYIARSLKIATEDSQFLNSKNYRIFGEQTKSIAVVENVGERFPAKSAALLDG